MSKRSKERCCSKEEERCHSEEEEKCHSKEEKKCHCDKCTREKLRAYYATLLVILLLGFGALFILYIAFFPIIIPPVISGPRKLILSNPSIVNTQIIKQRVPFFFTNKTNVPVNQTFYSYQSGYRQISAIIQTLRNVTTRYTFNITILGNQGIDRLVFEFLILSCPSIPYTADYIINPNCDIIGNLTNPITPLNPQSPIPISIVESATVTLTREKPQLFGIISIYLPSKTNVKYQNLYYSAESLAEF